MTQKGFAPILILVGILFAIVVAGGAYYLGTNNSSLRGGSKATDVAISPTATPSPSVSPAQNGADETANWKTYTNTKYGYSIKYPTDWEIADSGPTNDVIFLPITYDKTEKPPEVSIHLMNKSVVTSEDLVFAQFDYKTLNHNGITFLIGATTYTVGGPASQKVQDQAKSTLNKMYPTFKFTQ